jgi:hypothetical protein
MKATPTRIFPESFARQQMQKVARNIVQANERDGNLATVKIDSCWRVSSSRINCHLTTNVSKMDPYDGRQCLMRGHLGRLHIAGLFQSEALDLRLRLAALLLSHQRDRPVTS